GTAERTASEAAGGSEQGSGGAGTAAAVEGGAKRRRSRSRGSGGSKNRTAKETAPASTQEGSDMTNDVTVEEQATIMRTFLDGLVDAFDLDGSIAEEKVDDETIELQVEGVSTTSEGEEPRRRVVIVPATPSSTDES